MENSQKNLADSLQRELAFYKVKDDYFAQALDDQATRFSLITASLLALVGLLSFGGIKLEIASLKREYEKQVKILQKELSAYKRRVWENEYRLNITSGNNFSITGNILREKGKNSNAFELFIAASKSFLRSAILVKDGKAASLQEDPFKQSVSNLKSAIHILRTWSEDEGDLTKLREKSASISKSLNELSKTDNTDMIELSAECRVLLNTIIK